MFGTSAAFPLSDRILRKFTGKGPRWDFLAARPSRSRSFENYDFNVKALDTTNQWTVTAGATATTWAVLAEPGGWIRGVTGASVATGSLQLSIPTKYWNGTKGAGFASLIRLSAVTEIRVEMGFADVLPAINTTALNLASGTFNSIASGAVYVYDHTGSTTTSGLYTIGTSTAFGSVATTTNRFDSAATMFVALEVNSRSVSLWLGDQEQPIARAATGTTAADSWIPFIMVKTSTATKNVDIDSFITWTNGRN